jgi:hypothetical protein
MLRRIAAVVPLAAVAFVASAHADGDPASDVLYLKNVFLPYPAPSAAASRALDHAVAAAYAKRYRIKVAVVETPPDLGSVPELFGKPSQYAKFLGTELRSFYVGPLLVAMPAGFGIYDGGRSTAAENHVLAGVTTQVSNVDDLTRLTASLVLRLTAAGALRSRDVTKPFAIALPSTGSRGGIARLRYSARDDSMRSRLVIRIRARKRRKGYATITTALQTLQPQRIETLNWHAPRVLPAKLRFCVVAVDAAGNRSASACAPLLLR